MGTALAALLRWGLGEAIGPIPPYITFYPVVMLSAIIGGTGPGVLATILAVLTADLLFLEPIGRLVPTHPGDLVGMSLFCAINLALSIVGGRLRAARQQIRAEARRAEAQARDLEQLVRLLDLANVLVRDLDDRITRWNTGCRQLYGYTGEQALGQISHNLLRTRFGEPLETIRATLLATGRWDGELVHTTADGHEIAVASEWVLWRDATGSPVAVLETNTDITQRKRTEEAAAQLALIVESSDDAIISKTLDGTIRTWNDGAQRMFGYRPEEVIGKSITLLLPPDRIQEEQQILHRLQQGERLDHYETVRLAKDGREIDVSVTISPLKDPLGRITGASKIARDITERKRAEEALKSLNETLEQRVTERTAQLRELAGELTRAEQQERRRVARILHDNLQQLLVGAKFGTSILRSQLADESQRRTLQEVDDLLDELLAASRDLTIELSPPILQEGTLAAAMHWLARWMQDKHGLQVHVRADETVNPQDERTRILLFESVRELLFNTVKHAEAGSACLAMDRHNGEQVQIVVADSGVGFEAEQGSRQDHAGSGLGLRGMGKRLDVIGGRFQVDSAPGQGTRVTLVAPLAMSREERPQQRQW